MSMKYIRHFYGVPAYRGTRVRFTPDSRDKPIVGRIMSADSDAALLLCRFEGIERPMRCHPVWQMEYMTPDGWWEPKQVQHKAEQP